MIDVEVITMTDDLAQAYDVVVVGGGAAGLIADDTASAVAAFRCRRLATREPS